MLPRIYKDATNQLYSIQNSKFDASKLMSYQGHEKKKVITNDNFYIHEPNMASLTQLKAFLILLPMLWKKP